MEPRPPSGGGRTPVHACVRPVSIMSNPASEGDWLGPRACPFLPRGRALKTARTAALLSRRGVA